MTNHDKLVDWSVREVVILFMIIAVAYALRLLQLDNFTQGMLTGDEIYDSQIQIYRILSKQETYSGWSNYSYFLLAHAWYTLCGFSMTSIRLMSVLFGVISILYSYLLFRDLYGREIARASCLLLAFSVYHIHFSKLAMVNIYSTSFAMIFLYYYWLSTKTSAHILYCMLCGVALSLGIFSYPGFMSILPAIITVLIYFYIAARGHFILHGTGLKHIAILGSAATSFVMFYYLHVAYLSQETPLFRGGGGMDYSVSALRGAWIAIYHDLFIRGSSWYVGLGRTAFFEHTLIPFFAVGTILVAKDALRSRESSVRSPDSCVNGNVSLERIAAVFLFALFAFSILIVLVSGAYPGARRLLVVQPFFYLLCAIAICRIFKKTSIRSLAMSVISLATIVFYVLPLYSNGFWVQKNSANTHDDKLYDLLDAIGSDFAVAINEKEFGSQYHGEQYVAYVGLRNRYAGDRSQISSLLLTDDSGRTCRGYVKNAAANARKNVVYITTDKEGANDVRGKFGEPFVDMATVRISMNNEFRLFWLPMSVGTVTERCDIPFSEVGLSPIYATKEAEFRRLDVSLTEVQARALADWKALSVRNPSFLNVDLAQGRDSGYSTRYVRAVVNVEEAMQAILAIGSDDGVTVWLNGNQVHENIVARPANPGDDRVNIRLNPGKNVLVFRVNNVGGAWRLLAAVRPNRGRTAQ